jgi:hypothetical protein
MKEGAGHLIFDLSKLEISTFQNLVHHISGLGILIQDSEMDLESKFGRTEPVTQVTGKMALMKATEFGLEEVMNLKAAATRETQ